MALRLSDLIPIPFSAAAYGEEEGPQAALPCLVALDFFPSSAGASGGERGALVAAIHGAGLYTLQREGYGPSSVAVGGGERGALVAAIHGAGLYTLQREGYAPSSVGVGGREGGAVFRVVKEYSVSSALRYTGKTTSSELPRASGDYLRPSSEKSMRMLNGSQLGGNTLSLSWAHRAAKKQGFSKVQPSEQMQDFLLGALAYYTDDLGGALL